MKIFLLGSGSYMAQLLKKKIFKKNLKFIEYSRNKYEFIGAKTIFNKFDLHKKIPFFVKYADVNEECIFINFIGDYSLNKNNNFLNYGAIKKILLQIVNKNFKNKIHWIQLSSAGVYNIHIQKKFIEEDSELKPTNTYEKSKLKIDNFIINLSQKKNFTYTILRPTSVVSNRMKSNYFYNLIKLIKKNLFFYIKDKNCIINYCDINFLTEALSKIIQSKKKNNIYVLSNTIYLRDLVKIYSKIPSLVFVLPLFFAKSISSILSLFNIQTLTKSRVFWLTNTKIFSSKKIYKDFLIRPKNQIIRNI